MLTKILAATIAIFGTTSALFTKGTCSTSIPLESNFNLKSITGKWYEQARDKSSPREKFDCDTMEYTIYPDQTYLATILEYDPNNKKYLGAGTTIKCENGGPECKFYFNALGRGYDYRILNTDEKNYAVVYHCENHFGGMKEEFVWIYTREQKMSSTIDSKTKSIIDSKLPWYDRSKNLRFTKQGGDCQYMK